MKIRKVKQLAFARVNGWGGRRKGSGRPNLSGQVSHAKRAVITAKNPLHITLRLRTKLPSLRKKSLLKSFNESVKGAKKFGLRVIHFSIQANHLHLFCEGQSNKEVALGMRALAGRFAKQVRANAAATCSTAPTGSVFNGRYHLHVLKTPQEVRNALEYVLLNLSKHQNFIEYIDAFSSGRYFRHWRELLGKRFRSLIRADAEFFARKPNEGLDSGLFGLLSPPESWLARKGWLKAGP